jgi:DNA-binding NarL/FixJ family response regulator
MNAAAPIRVAMVEDNAGLRESLGVLLNGTPGFLCAGAFGSAEAALDALPAMRPEPEVVLMDIHLPGKSGIECVRELRDRLPQTRIVMLTVFATSDRIFQALTAGASGYLSKRTAPADLLAAIQEVHRGGAPMSGDIAARVVEYFNARGQAREPDLNLSPRETEILQLLAEGLLYKEIRDRLGLSIDTVQWHIRNIYRKLHVRSRAQAVAKLYRHENLPPPAQSG